MDKKVWLGIGLSGMVMVGSVLSVSAQSAGYESYKTALKQMSVLDNVTNQVKVRIQDNQQTLFSLQATAMIDKKNDLQHKSVVLEKAGQKEELEIFNQNQQMFIENVQKGEYFSLDDPRPSFHKSEERNDIQKDLEPIIDTLTHNLQKEFTETEREDGTKEIDLELTNDQIPMIANAVGAFVVKHGLNHERMGEHPNQVPGILTKDMKPDFPKLQDEIKIEKFHLSAHLDNTQYLDDQTIAFMVSGNDNAGVHHELTFQVDMDFSNMNKTTIQPLDLKGKKVQILEHFGKRFGR